MLNKAGVKLMDFGIAKNLNQGQHLTQPNMIIGTLEYMSPEQMDSNAQLGFNSDFYSLGATAYTMLTGKNYIDGNSVEKIKNICSGNFVIEIPNIHPNFLEVIRRMMKLAPEHRFQSVQELRKALKV